MTRREQACLWVYVALAALAAGTSLGRAQPVAGGRGFKFAEPYDPPHETQMKSLLEGARAERQADGRMLVNEAKWRTFRENGEGELVVEAPQCMYDPGRRSISSPGPLRVQTADGKFSIEGEGFLWQQTNSTLLVSNRVHTILHPGLLATPSATARAQPEAAERAGIDIYSDQFEYAEKSGKGVYEGNVRVSGTNLTSTAGKLTILLPLAGRRLQSLTAEGRVKIEYEKIQATGERAYYSAETDLIRLTGQPTWRMEQREGSGEELVYDRTNRVFRANGHARLRMPAQSLGAAGFLGRSGPATSEGLAAANQLVEIQCDSYELRTNLAVFRDQVRVTDRRGEQAQAEMSCDLMALTLAGTNQVQKMVAERRVVIAQEDGRFTAELAEYNGTNSLLDLTGNPGWRTGLREGSGEWIRLNLEREEMLVRGKAVMRLPAGDVGRSALGAKRTAAAGSATGQTGDWAEIRSEEYLVTREAALFQGGVRVEHPQMKWTCAELTMLSPPELGKSGRMVIAEPTVVFDVKDDQGRNFHGTGRKAIYTRRTTATLTNEIMELTGNPAVVQATNLVGWNSVITLDLASQKLLAPGKYRVGGMLPTGVTNSFRPPKDG